MLYIFVVGVFNFFIVFIRCVLIVDDDCRNWFYKILMRGDYKEFINGDKILLISVYYLF